MGVWVRDRSSTATPKAVGAPGGWALLGLSVGDGMFLSRTPRDIVLVNVTAFARPLPPQPRRKK